MNKSVISPELRRNIWLDFTFHRVIMTPLVVILIVSLFHLTGGAKSSADIAFKLALLFIFIWGTKRASETVIEEVNKSTWDFQRQSAILPWQMTWGKLIGSTLYSWYGTFFCFLFYVTYQYPNSALFGFKSHPLTVSHEILLLILGGLFGQSIALLLSIQGLSRIRREKNNPSFRYFLIGMLAGLFMTGNCFNGAKAINKTIIWHSYIIESGLFTFTSLILFLGWAILGLQRSFCKELQYQHIPWVWLIFNLFCMVYFSGFASFEQLPIDKFPQLHGISALQDLQKKIEHAPLYTAFFIAQILTYFALFGDDVTFIRYKYLFARLKEKNVIETLTQLPWWPISFTFTLLAGILVVYMEQKSILLTSFSPSIFVLTILLFLTRDVTLIHYFNFGKNPRRAVGASVLYLFLLYLLFPLLLSALHLNHLLPLLIPSWGQNTPLALFSSLSQIAILSYLCLNRWTAQKEGGTYVPKGPTPSHF